MTTCIGGYRLNAENKVERIECSEPTFAGLAYCLMHFKEQHSETRKKMWDPGDTYTVCLACEQQVDCSPCDVMKLIMWIEELGAVE